METNNSNSGMSPRCDILTTRGPYRRYASLVELRGDTARSGWDEPVLSYRQEMGLGVHRQVATNVEELNTNSWWAKGTSRAAVGALPMHSIQIIKPQLYISDFLQAATIRQKQNINRGSIPGLTICLPIMPPKMPR